MAKKTAKTPRVSPVVPTTNTKHVTYDNLDNGECFLWGGRLMMKYDVSDQEAFDLSGEGFKECMCDEVVIPVDIKVTWKKK